MAGYTTPTPNPNPNRITAAWWWFMWQLLLLEPRTENSGIYGNKPGYHGTRAENRARNGWNDYSVRAPLDRLGPDNKAAAGDWTHKSAQGGNYARMALFGARLLAAFNARDPRLRGWREVLGQTDGDKPAEGLDFQSWTKRVPDSTHEWHFHFSELRAFVESFVNKEAMLSILRGESLAAYLDRGGQLITIGDDVSWTDDVIPAPSWAADHETNPNWQAKSALGYCLELTGQLQKTDLPAMRAAVARVEQKLAAVPAEPAPIDYDLLAAALLRRIAAGAV